VFLSGITLGIYHPSGDVKKISYANKPGVPARWSDNEPDN